MDEKEKKVINWKPYIITTIIVTIIGAFIYVLFRFILKVKTADGNLANRPPLDGAGFAFLILALLGVFMWLGREGVFDIFAYGFRQFGSVHFTKNPNQFNDFPGYKQDKMIKRSKRPKLFLVPFIISGLFLIATLILYIIAKA